MNKCSRLCDISWSRPRGLC